VTAAAEGLLSPYTITLGDEFQAVYKVGDSLFRDFTHVQYRLYPERVRFAVGVGRLTTAINRDRAIGMDGPAFHLSRESIQELKKWDRIFGVKGIAEDANRWVQPALTLLSHMELSWKKSRFQILYSLLDDQAAQAVAQSLRLSRAAVYKNIQAGALNTVIEIYREVTTVINESLAQK
jgi:hypothetical protein